MAPSAFSVAGRSDQEPAGEAETLLVVAEGWTIDPVALDVLHRRLESLSAEFAGVAPMEAWSLPPGCTVRTAAERRAAIGLEPSRQPPARAHGVALLRAGETFALVGNEVVIDDSRPIALEPRSEAHPPARVPSGHADASPLAVPLYRKRAVALFLALGDEDHAVKQWAVSMSDQLVALGVDAPIAAERTPEPRLSAPCSPSRASALTLNPDVVVTLDDPARSAIDAWFLENPRTVQIDLEVDRRGLSVLPGPTISTDSRLRAAIGPDVAADELASLVIRLASGPHLFPPTGNVTRADPEPPRLAGTRPKSSELSILAVDGEAENGWSRRAESLYTFVSPHTKSMDRVRLGAASATQIQSADVLVLHEPQVATDLADLIAVRRAEGHLTVLDVGGRPTEAEVRIARTCGLAFAATPMSQRQLSRDGVRCFLLPSRLLKGELASLKEARRSSNAEADQVLRIGWRIAPHRPASDDALAVALADLLEADRIDLRVWGSDQRPAALAADDRAIWFPKHLEPSPSELGSCSLQVLSHDPDEPTDLMAVYEAAACGVATIGFANPDLGSAIADGNDGILVRSSGDWSAILQRAASDPDDLRQLGRHAAERADEEFGPRAGEARGGRLMGWLQREIARR